MIHSTSSTTDDGCPAAGLAPRGAWRRDRGYATAEAALVLPVLLIVLALAAWVLVCVNGQLRCVDGARTAARIAARGDSLASAEAAGRAVAPAGALVQIRLHGRQVEVVVTAEVQPFGAAIGVLPPVHVRARTAGEREDVPQ